MKFILDTKTSALCKSLKTVAVVPKPELCLDLSRFKHDKN